MADNVSDYLSVLISEGVFPAGTTSSDCIAAVRDRPVVMTSIATLSNGNTVPQSPSDPDGKDFVVDQQTKGNLPAGTGQIRLIADPAQSSKVLVELTWTGDAIPLAVDSTELTREMYNWITRDKTA